MRKVRSRTAVQLRSEQVAVASPAMEADVLWPIAMLRIAIELKRPGSPAVDEIIEGVVTKLGIPRLQFERYLSEHIGTLQESVHGVS
jgi:hypothetical protein